MDFPFISLIIFLPALGALLVAVLPWLSEKGIKQLSLITTAVPLVLSFILFVQFDRSASMAGEIQFGETVPWIPIINAHYSVGVDGISLPMILLSTIIGLFVILVSWKTKLRVREYFAWLLLLQAAVTGVFASLDFLLFFIFWEIELIPMYFLIAIWGSGRKEYSAMKYVIYTLFGGAFILAGILMLFFSTDTLSITELAQTNLKVFMELTPLTLAFFFFFIGFAVKLPVFPFHTWLPDAHTDAPTAASVVLAGTLLKMGGYAMLRVNVSMFPDLAQTWGPLLLGLATVNVLYGGAITLRQTDIKRLIAYSSVSHMGFVLLGIFALGQVSMTGATLQMFSHGIVTGLLFAVTGTIMHNSRERNIDNMGGLIKQVPIAATIFIIGGLGSMAVPTTSGFIAEVMVFLGAFQSNIVTGVQVFTLLSLLGILLAAGYILWTIQRVFFGQQIERFKGIPDATASEKLFGIFFVLLIFLVGVYPTILTDIINGGIVPLANFFGS
jgi:NADH-quinone oxidoreductase subunit M